MGKNSKEKMSQRLQMRYSFKCFQQDNTVSIIKKEQWGDINLILHGQVSPRACISNTFWVCDMSLQMNDNDLKNQASVNLLEQNTSTLTHPQ